MIKFRLIFAGFMVAVYLVMAGILVFSDFFDINPILRIFMGVVFLLYGVFRGIRLWQKGF